MIKRFIISAAIAASFVVAGGALALSISDPTPLTNCGNEIGTPDWCSCYIADAVTACNNGWSIGACTKAYQDTILRQTAGDPAGMLKSICNQQYSSGHLPKGVTADDCVADLQGYPSCPKPSYLLHA